MKNSLKEFATVIVTSILASAVAAIPSHFCYNLIAPQFNIPECSYLMAVLVIFSARLVFKSVTGTIED